MAEQQADYQKALACYHECLEISREMDDPDSLAMSYNSMGNVYGNQGIYDSAEENWKKALEIWQAMDAPEDNAVQSGLAAAMDNLGNVAFSRRQIREALDYYFQGYELRVRIGNQALAAYSLVNLGTAELALGERSMALSHFHEGLKISHGLNDLVGIGYFLFGLADLALPEPAARLLGRCDQIREDIEISLNQEETVAYLALVEKLRTTMAPDAYEAALDQGRRMDIHRAVEEALAVKLE